MIDQLPLLVQTGMFAFGICGRLDYSVLFSFIVTGASHLPPTRQGICWLPARTTVLCTHGILELWGSFSA